jgi:hypothetical protein
MTRKIARQSEATPLHTLDDYLWNQRLGVTQLPPIDMSQGEANTSSLPPQTSQAPTIDYDSSVSPSDMFGSGVSGQGQLIAPKAPTEVPRSTPAVGKTASTGAFDLAKHLMDDHGVSKNSIRDHDENVKLHVQEHVNYPDDPHYMSNTDRYGEPLNKTSAISTLYGDVDPTPTTGESSGNGAQSNRNNSSEHLPNGPDSSPTSGLAEGEEGGAGLAADLGEAGSLALLASKYKIGSALDPIVAKFKYIRHNKKTGKWEIFSRKTGKTLSTHSSEKEAESAFKAMESNMHH